MGALITFYPRGFSTQPSGPNPEAATSSGDPQIDTLYKLYIARSVNTDSWEFRRRVITAASPLFGDLLHWFAFQASMNNKVYALNYKFLEDTLRFIQTGKREMSVMTWLDLLLEWPEEKANIATIQRLKGMNLTDVQPWLGEQGISRWLSHPSGFDDFITTVHIVFGASKPVLMRKK